MNSRRLLQHFPRVNAAYQGYRQWKKMSRPATRTPHGFWLSGNADMELGNFEPAETELVRAALEGIDVLVNVGANIGYYCCLALAAGKQVLAFEPLPDNLRMLMRNMQLNDWSDRVEIFPMAIGARTGIIELFGGGTGASLVPGWAGQSAKHVTSVPISTLDTLLGTRLIGKKCLVLIDVEGAELAVLRGASGLLANCPKPIWIVEIAVHEHQPHGTSINPHLVDTFELFCNAGYQAVTADVKARSISLGEVKQVASTSKDTLGTHNFLFQEDG